MGLHIIRKKRLREFYSIHPDSEEPLLSWYRLAKHATWRSLVDVRQTYPSADRVQGRTVFNIKGNDYRLITVIQFDAQRIYIREVLTHAQYDTDD